MIGSALFLSLIGLASVNGLPSHEVAAYPPKSVAKGFRLVVNMTDPSKDFHPPVHNTYVALFPFQADFGIAAAAKIGSNGTPFFRNGTKAEQAAGQSTILTDEWNLRTAHDWDLWPDKKNPGLSTVHLDAGRGTRGATLPDASPVAYMVPGQYLVCNQTVPADEVPQFSFLDRRRPIMLIRQTTVPNKVPGHCRPVRLVPECTELNKLNPGHYPTRNFVLDSPCYKKVSTIKWDQYRC
jgi:hypothetical protein